MNTWLLISSKYMFDLEGSGKICWMEEIRNKNIPGEVIGNLKIQRHTSQGFV